ncbi:MAG TPA: hypothetical protein VN695_03950 [Streptosporangiaceae bacterium]|nr:hypothetical protein [Streptosporangiaceae bacterium]
MADALTSPQRSSPLRRWRLALAIAPLLLAATSVPALAHAAVPAGTAAPPDFTIPHGPVLAGQVALFTAPRAPGVTGYTWTLSGPGVDGGHFSATCGASTSEMESSFGKPGTMHIKLRITNVSGTTSTASRGLAVKSAKVSPISKNMASQATQWILCKRGPADPAVRPVSNGGPPAGCQDEYFDGNIDAIGCLSMLASYNKIPAAEYKLLCPVFPTTCTTSKTPVVPELLPVLSTEPLRLNGIDIAPGKDFVLDQNDGWMAASSATASLLNGVLPLHTHQLKLAEYTQPIFRANLTDLIAKYPALATALSLSGFEVTGHMAVSLAHRTSLIKASVTLPGSFTDSGGHPVTSSAAVIAGNQAGLVLHNLLIAVPSADFGGALEFDHLAFCYQQHISEDFCEKKTGANFGSFEGTSASSWNATAEINILGTEIKAVPSPVDPQQGIGFVNGQLNFAGATASFSPAIPLGSTGVSLSSLQASLALNPTRFTGSIGITAGDLVSINGQLFMVFASPGQPYTFTGHEVGASGMPGPTVRAFALAVGGTVGLTLPVVGNTTLGSGYVLFAYPAYLAVGGNVGFSILDGALSVNGGVNGQFSLSNAAFEVEGNINIHALFLTMGADVIVSSVGIGACGSIGTPFGPVTAGVGYMWGGQVNASVGSCDLGPYGVIIPGAGNSSRTKFQLSVRANLPTEMVQVRGLRGAPELTITGPGGVRASIGAGSKAFGKPFAIYRFGHTTYIAIIKPKAGVYTITANRGSPRITEVLHADGRGGVSLRQRFGVRVTRG